MSDPTVSVLMPAYNAERYIKEAVRSVLEQSFADFELLVIDDGSTDGTRRTLEGLAARDQRVRLTSRPNTGYLVALNEMLNRARGEFLARMDADDVADPGRFAEQVSYLRSHPECAVVGSAVLLVDTDGDPIAVWNGDRTTHEEIDRAHLREGACAVICHPSAMMRAEQVRSVGGYRAETCPAEDLDLWLRLAEVGRLANLPQPLLQYRVHPSSVSHARKAEQHRGARRAVLEACARRGLDPWSHPVYDADPADSGTTSSGPADLRRRWGWWALGAGYIATARKHAWGALRQSPGSLESWRLACCAIRGR